MKKKTYTLLLTLTCWLTANITQAQDSLGVKPAEKIEMADALRANGKIYVVVACLVIILLGIIAYIIRLDRKITRLEKEIK